ncbi:TM2 domain-containing protein [Sphingomonas morindae]|uniref:TM2 domain-containing protein n=1 Tax=Sphingomonas morindae TaxID=1541170 RepID=A0ABY4XAZ9_9SPHN|nr:TM2 domain-containing protein [Sphingomonas morindae]USI74014.1 TM2 domain-containing protein [Sphingomonas morindae]
MSDSPFPRGTTRKTPWPSGLCRFFAAAGPWTQAAPDSPLPRSRALAVALAFTLGGLGAHKFYLRRVGWGLAYLLLCWTLVPLGAALIEGIFYLLMDDDQFHHKYG